MQLIQSSNANTPVIKETNRPSENIRSGGWLSRVFGCWHMELSRPIPARVRHIESVLDVEHVGQFNPRTWKMLGKFYYNLPKGTHSIKAT